MRATCFRRMGRDFLRARSRTSPRALRAAGAARCAHAAPRDRRISRATRSRSTRAHAQHSTHLGRPTLSDLTLDHLRRNSRKFQETAGSRQFLSSRCRRGAHRAEGRPAPRHRRDPACGRLNCAASSSTTARRRWCARWSKLAGVAGHRRLRTARTGRSYRGARQGRRGVMRAKGEAPMTRTTPIAARLAQIFPACFRRESVSAERLR